MTNPLLTQTRMPGGKFAIPSGGIFYENGELAPTVLNGEVYVYPMTAYDEILMRSPDMLMDGSAIETVVKRCVPEVEQPLRLLSKDLDFLLICIRCISFGNEVELTHKHDCENAKEHQYTVSIDDFVSKTKNINPTAINSEYRFKQDDKLVYLTPIRYDTMIEVLKLDTEQLQHLPKDEYVKQVFEITTKQLAQVINKVVIPSSGSQLEDIVVNDHKHIHEWVKQCSPLAIKSINNHIQKAGEWGPALKYQIKCKDCNKNVPIDIPLNPMHFFM